MTRQALRGGAIMAMAALPVVALGMLALQDPRQRYWAWVYVVWGTLFAALCCFAAASRVIHRWIGTDPPTSTKSFFISGLTAWALSFPILLLNVVTPLCVGQDNGDGRNNIATCILFAVVWFIFMSLPVCGCLALLARWASKSPTGDRAQTMEPDQKQNRQPSPPRLPRAPRAGHSEGGG